MNDAPRLAMPPILVEIDLGDLVGDAGPVSLGHVVPDAPVGKELSHLEQVLLLLPLRLLRRSGRRSAARRRRRRRRSGGAEVSEEAERLPQQV